MIRGEKAIKYTIVFCYDLLDDRVFPTHHSTNAQITPRLSNSLPISRAPRYRQEHGLTLAALIIVSLDTRVKDKEKEKSENDYDINENDYQW